MLALNRYWVAHADEPLAVLARQYVKVQGPRYPDTACWITTASFMWLMACTRDDERGELVHVKFMDVDDPGDAEHEVVVYNNALVSSFWKKRMPSITPLGSRIDWERVRAGEKDAWSELCDPTECFNFAHVTRYAVDLEEARLRARQAGVELG